MKKFIKFMMIICLTVFVSPRLGVTEGEFLSPDPNIGVEVTTDKTTASVNEKIKLNYYLYTRYDTRYEGFESYPSFRGFSVDLKPVDRNVPKETVRVNGKRYVKACIKEVVLSPIYGGHLVINPGVVKVAIAEESKKAGPVLTAVLNAAILGVVKVTTAEVRSAATSSTWRGKLLPLRSPGATVLKTVF